MTKEIREMLDMISKYYKVAISILLVMNLLIFSIPSGVAVSNTDASFKVVASVPVGSGVDKISIMPVVEGDTARGPQSLTVLPNGEIMVLDAIQRQILILKDGQYQESILLPFTVYPTDILVDAGRVYVLDAKNVFVVDRKGALVGQYPLPEGLEAKFVSRLTRRGNAQITLWLVDGAELALNSLPAKYDIVSQTSIKDENNGYDTGIGRVRTRILGLNEGRIDLPDRGVQIPVISHGGALGGIRIVGSDGYGAIYALVEELVDPAPVVAVELTIRKYLPTGTLAGVAKLPLPEFVNYPNRTVEVMPNGDVYVMIPRSDVVQVSAVQLGTWYKSELTVMRDKLAAYDDDRSVRVLQSIAWGVKRSGTGQGTSLSRSQVRSRAITMANTTWTWHNTYDYLPNGNSRPSTATKPNHLVGAAEGSTQTGIPYNWGGWDAPWAGFRSEWGNGSSDCWICSSSLSWSGVLGRYYPNKGPLVGNVGTGYPAVAYSAGIDCSGYVSAAADNFKNGQDNDATYYYAKPATGHLGGSNSYSRATAVGNNQGYSSWSSIQPMDFLLSSGHVLYYNHRRTTGTGIYTYEATTSGSKQGAKFWNRSWSELSGYALRSWWPVQAGDDFTNALTTVPNSRTVIQGTNVYYKITNSAGYTRTLTVSVTPSSGDPDLSAFNASYGYITGSYQYGADTVSFSVGANANVYVRVEAFNDTSYSISATWN